MLINSVKHVISSLKLAKKSTSAIFKDRNFSSLVSRFFDKDVTNNAFINPNITNSSNLIYYTKLYQYIKNNKFSDTEIKAIATKFQKILSLEIEQNIIQRMLNGKYANHIQNYGGAYDIFRQILKCDFCNKTFETKNISPKITTLNINLLPTVCTIWHPNSLPDNLAKIGKIANNTFKANINNKAKFFYPLNLIIIYNGNHSANSALYENNSNIENILFYDITHWFDDIYFDPEKNQFIHNSCNNVVLNEVFHENIGYIYEISKLLYQNNIIFKLTDIL